MVRRIAIVVAIALLGWSCFWAVTQIGKRRAKAYHDSLAGVYFLHSYPRKQGLNNELEMLALLRTGRSRSILLTAWTEHVGFGGTVEGHWTLKDGKISVVPERVDGSPPDVLAGNFPKDGLKRKGTGDLQLCFENAYSSTNAEYLTDL